jgi:hypothetical protein
MIAFFRNACAWGEAGGDGGGSDGGGVWPQDSPGRLKARLAAAVKAQILTLVIGHLLAISNVLTPCLTRSDAACSADAVSR